MTVSSHLTFQKVIPNRTHTCSIKHTVGSSICILSWECFFFILLHRFPRKHKTERKTKFHFNKCQFSSVFANVLLHTKNFAILKCILKSILRILFVKIERKYHKTMISQLMSFNLCCCNKMHCVNLT